MWRMSWYSFMCTQHHVQFCFKATLHLIAIKRHSQVKCIVMWFMHSWKIQWIICESAHINTCSTSKSSMLVCQTYSVHSSDQHRTTAVQLRCCSPDSCHGNGAVRWQRCVCVCVCVCVGSFHHMFLFSTRSISTSRRQSQQIIFELEGREASVLDNWPFYWPMAF